MTIHERALVEGQVGARTSVWAFAHVMPGAVVGDDCNIGEGAFIERGALLGDRVTVKNHVLVWDGVTVGDDVFLGPGVVFTNDMFPRSARGANEAEFVPVKTVVESGVSIGANATIICGVTIGAGALVGAGAVVTTDVAPGALVVGNPARRIGDAPS